MVVCAIGIGALATTMASGLLSPRVFSDPWKSKSRVAKAEVASIAQQVTLYLADSSLGMPSMNTFRLSDLTAGPIPYLKADDLVDPWGRPYMLIVPGVDGSGYGIVSYGSDGVPGGSGADADIVQ